MMIFLLIFGMAWWKKKKQLERACAQIDREENDAKQFGVVGDIYNKIEGTGD